MALALALVLLRSHGGFASDEGERLVNLPPLRY
jgi:hypothetical protein